MRGTGAPLGQRDAPGFHNGSLATLGSICRPGEDEQEVGEPVQVPERLGIHGRLSGQSHGQALRPPADRSRHVEACRHLRTAREHEAAQRLEALVDEVAELLQRAHLARIDPEPFLCVVERHGEVGAQVEELVLDALEPAAELVRRTRREDEAERGVELVDGSVRPIRGSVLDTRAPPPRLVSPASPPPV